MEHTCRLKKSSHLLFFHSIDKSLAGRGLYPTTQTQGSQPPAQGIHHNKFLPNIHHLDLCSNLCETFAEGRSVDLLNYVLACTSWPHQSTSAITKLSLGVCSGGGSLLRGRIANRVTHVSPLALPPLPYLCLLFFPTYNRIGFAHHCLDPVTWALEQMNSMETPMMVKIKKKGHWYLLPISLERMNPNSEKEETDIRGKSKTKFFILQTSWFLSTI